jgi:hypothetical protein
MPQIRLTEEQERWLRRLLEGIESAAPPNGEPEAHGILKQLYAASPDDADAA